jgi:pimeloyl-ACP methyl ester carboxylesterase
MPAIDTKSCLAPDKVTIVYSTAGRGEPGLVFVHGGLADRSFWNASLEHFAPKHRVAALDLPGHGDSGLGRRKWGIPEFGADVKAVVRAARLDRVVLVGNSLGGPVAIEAALLLPGKAVMVIGVDTFHSLDYAVTPEEARERAEAFRRDFAGSVREMTRRLFHPDADPEIMAEAERRMARTSPNAAYVMFLSLGGYDVAAAARKLDVPLRAICGDLYPVDFSGVRRVKPDFEAIIMDHVGHYPMLERPEEFNKHLEALLLSVSK